MTDAQTSEEVCLTVMFDTLQLLEAFDASEVMLALDPQTLKWSVCVRDV